MIEVGKAGRASWEVINKTLCNKDKGMLILVCSYCNTEIEIEYLSDIVECPNCGEVVSKETAGAL